MWHVIELNTKCLGGNDVAILMIVIVAAIVIDLVILAVLKTTRPQYKMNNFQKVSLVGLIILLIWVAYQFFFVFHVDFQF